MRLESHRRSVRMEELGHFSVTCRLLSSVPHRDANNSVEGGDHRLMALEARWSGDIAIVVCGDSSGKLIVWGLRDDIPLLVPLAICSLHSTPLLSLKLASKFDRLYAVVGCASGDIIVADLTALTHEGESLLKAMNEESLRAANRIGQAVCREAVPTRMISSVHNMGVNGLCVLENDDMTCISVGEDQNIRLTSLTDPEDRLAYSLVSGSSLRSICRVDEYILVTGWEQKVQRWKCYRNQIQLVDSFAVQVPETTCLDSVKEGALFRVAVCGAMGLEVFDLPL